MLDSPFEARFVHSILTIIERIVPSVQKVLIHVWDPIVHPQMQVPRFYQ